MSQRNDNRSTPKKKKLRIRDRIKNQINKVANALGLPSIGKVKLPKGGEVSKETYNKVKSQVEGVNTAYRQRQQDIVRNAKQKLSREVARAIEQDIDETNRKARRRLTSGKFDDLKELDFENIIKNIENEDDLIKIGDSIATNEFYDLGMRDEMYRENYLKAMYKNYGDNTDTRELEKIIRDMDIDEFIMSYYNPYSNTQIKDFYDPEQVDEYISYLKDYFTKLGKK